MGAAIGWLHRGTRVARVRAEYPSHRWIAAGVRRCSGFPYITEHKCFFQRGWKHGGFQQVLVHRTGSCVYWTVKTRSTLVEAAPDRRNNAHLVLHPIEDLDWSSGSESQTYAKTEYELR